MKKFFCDNNRTLCNWVDAYGSLLGKKPFTVDGLVAEMGLKSPSNFYHYFIDTDDFICHAYYCAIMRSNAAARPYLDEPMEAFFYRLNTDPKFVRLLKIVQHTLDTFYFRYPRNKYHRELHSQSKPTGIVYLEHNYPDAKPQNIVKVHDAMVGYYLLNINNVRGDAKMKRLLTDVCDIGLALIERHSIGL